MTGRCIRRHTCCRLLSYPSVFSPLVLFLSPWSEKLTFRIPTGVGIAQRQAKAPRHAARPSLDGGVTAGDKVALGLCVFDVVTCSVGEVRVVLWSRHLGLVWAVPCDSNKCTQSLCVCLVLSCLSWKRCCVVSCCVVLCCVWVQTEHSVGRTDRQRGTYDGKRDKKKKKELRAPPPFLWNGEARGEKGFGKRKRGWAGLGWTTQTAVT